MSSTKSEEKRIKLAMCYLSKTIDILTIPKRKSSVPLHFPHLCCESTTGS